jgi:DNA-binding GntR family transcriptional regulator
LTALKARDAAGARDAMKRHLQSAEQDLRSIDSADEARK